MITWQKGIIYSLCCLSIPIIIVLSTCGFRSKSKFMANKLILFPVYYMNNIAEIARLLSKLVRTNLQIMDDSAVIRYILNAHSIL